jgi:hypothetical protein
VWDTIRAIERKDALDWIVSRRWFDIPLNLVEEEYGCDLAAGGAAASPPASDTPRIVGQEGDRHSPPPAEPHSTADAPSAEEVSGGDRGQGADPPWTPEELAHSLQPQEQRLVNRLFGRGRVPLRLLCPSVWDMDYEDLKKGSPNAIPSAFHKARKFLKGHGYNSQYDTTEMVAWIEPLSQGEDGVSQPGTSS